MFLGSLKLEWRRTEIFEKIQKHLTLHICFNLLFDLPHTSSFLQLYAHVTKIFKSPTTPKQKVKFQFRFVSGEEYDRKKESEINGAHIKKWLYAK